MYKVIFFATALILGSMFHEARADGPSPAETTYKPNYKELKKPKTKVATTCTCNKKVTKTVRYTVHTK